jgi:hypothetical protein
MSEKVKRRALDGARRSGNISLYRRLRGLWDYADDLCDFLRYFHLSLEKQMIAPGLQTPETNVSLAVEI